MSKIDRRHALKHSVAAVGSAGAWLAAGSLPATNLLHAEDGATGSLSPVVRENQHPGARDWQLTRVRLDARDGKRSPAIEGYCSKQSVAAGEQIEFMVSTTPPQRFRIEIFRTGYYGGRGARLMKELGPYEGTSQPMPEVGPKRLRECRWQPTTAFTIPADWLSGVYLARLTTLLDESGHGYWQSYAVFIVRDDRPADILLQCSDNTWQAYNQWPDNYSLYTHPDGNQGPWADVSFDRPYGKYPQIYENPQSIGSGEWLCFEFPMAYWLEQQGYDVSYCSNADMLNPTRGLKCKAFISNGHDEYWDIRQFESVVTMREAGVNLLFLSGNSVCWVAPFRESSDGRANRITFRGGPYGGDYKLAVVREKENGPFPHRGPDEGYLLGARNVDPVNGGGDWICALPEHWIFEGTGMQRGEPIPGMIGWEYHGDPPQDIPGLEIVAEGTALQGGVNPQHWTATIYPGPKGNYVFNASTIWWCQGLANPPGHMLPWSHWSRPHGPDERIQRITHNMLGRAGAKPADNPASADGFVSIFDGRTLDGWEAAPSESATSWTVRDGMIIGVGYKRRSHLTYSRNKQIGNFELRFSYRLPGEGNTGVNIRAIPDPTKKRDFQSYHADIGHLGIGKEILGAWDFHTPGRTEHRCYQGDSLVIDRNDQPTITPIVNGLKDEHIKDRDWNDAQVIAQDNTFKLFINGKLASEFIEHVPLERRLLKGMLQLQLHDPGMIVHFKDVRLKVMD